MRVTLGLLCAGFLIGAVTPGAEDAPAPGAVVGSVRFTGPVPPARKILTTDGQTLLHSDLVVDPRTKGLRFVAVVLENAPARPRAAPGKPVLVDQRDMVFTPRVVAVQHGQVVRFENNDRCNHSVMAHSALEANQFNLIASPGQPVEHAFAAQKRPVPIGCSIHAWMRAWVFVLPHPWFAVTDAEGKFRIDRVPPGKYTLLLTHPDTNHQERRAVEVTGGKAVSLDVIWEKVDRGKK